ncbi:MAG: hypF [Deltaproteobacteria bacterium]|nr:hypF [Deltaproteobacteria bacterium]
MTEPDSALRIHVKGVVQGVGFRPFVYGLAARHRVKGWVLNSTSGVVMEVEGAPSALNLFCRDLAELSPPLSRIEEVERQPIPANGHLRFDIRESEAEAGYVLISPDIATCETCRKELFDPGDRRYRYPFINCTNCGPRFTIIEDVPYDRPLTTMAPFTMCPDCRSEYDDPLNRRFHAQPNACPVCGPRAWLAPSSAGEEDALTAPEGDPASSGMIEACAHMLRSGKIIALKGLGGFHLACDATNPQAVERLRERKGRFAKPFAVMMASLDVVRQHGETTAPEEEALIRPSCPIVLISRSPGSTVAREVAPGNRYLGVMLPYTPLHHLLLNDVGGPLVMTSGNLSEEPIAGTNKEAWDRLRGIADGFLFHNREIYARYDDGVWFIPSVPGEYGEAVPAPQPIRRSRGDAPFPLKLPFASRELLACGPELKNTFCLTRDRYAFLSQHIGDMENIETIEHFETSVRTYEQLFRLRPAALVHDMHPDYLSTRYAEQRASRETLPLLGVQHHHAHAVSCMIDNGTTEPVIAVTMDGTGYGLDGRMWGGEWLIADAGGFRRAASLEYLPLPGGDAGIRHPGRTAFAYLHWLLGPGFPLPAALQLEEPEKRVLARQVDRGVNISWTSSCGRLFDVVTALAGGCLHASYEAQGAIEMEMLSRDAAESYPYGLRLTGQSLNWGETGCLPACSRFHEVALAPLLRSVLRDVREGRSLGDIGSKFHRSIARMAGEVSRRIAEETGLTRVTLSGGCFQNRLLLKLTVEELRKHHLRPLLHRQVPANDGGISLGQAAIGHFALK